MRELLYNAADHVRRGKALAEAGNRQGALKAYADALRDLHAVKPQRQRDVLLAHVYLSRFQLAPNKRDKAAQHDLRVGYSYARTAAEPGVRYLAETLWQAHLLAAKEASSCAITTNAPAATLPTKRPKIPPKRRPTPPRG